MVESFQNIFLDCKAIMKINNGWILVDRLCIVVISIWICVFEYSNWIGSGSTYFSLGFSEIWRNDKVRAFEPKKGRFPRSEK